MPRELEQGRRWTPPHLGALPAAQPAGEIVHERGRGMLHRRKIDVARRLATRALDLQPGKTTVDGLVDGRRRIDRFAVRPHPLVPAFAEKPVGLLDQRFALGPRLGRLRGQNIGHRARLAELLRQSLAIAARQGRGVVFWGHPDIQAQRDRIGNPVRVRAPRTPASTRLPRVSRCAAGRCRPAAAGRHPSRPHSGHRAGPHRPSGFPPFGRSGGS